MRLHLFFRAVVLELLLGVLDGHLVLLSSVLDGHGHLCRARPSSGPYQARFRSHPTRFTQRRSGAWRAVRGRRLRARAGRRAGRLRTLRRRSARLLNASSAADETEPQRGTARTTGRDGAPGPRFCARLPSTPRLVCGAGGAASGRRGRPAGASTRGSARRRAEARTGHPRASGGMFKSAVPARGVPAPPEPSDNAPGPRRRGRGAVAQRRRQMLAAESVR